MARSALRTTPLLVVLVSIALLSLGCSVRVQPESTDFEKLCGKGPILLVPTDEAAASTVFFRRNWTASPTIKHLVTERGTPEAISLEREFLRPNRLKLFYPTAGQVYLLDHVGGEWLVAGSEPVEPDELELVVTQRQRNNQMAPAAIRVSDSAPKPVEAAPVAAIPAAEFRGMLKPPGKAAVAPLPTAARKHFIHTVSFAGEDLAILADWYTLDAGNATPLAHLNRRSAHTQLRIGEQIAIPRELMRNPDPLPEAMVP